MEDERDRWDCKYREGSHFSLDPDPLLPYAYEQFVEPLFPNAGVALDVAGGVGRHAIWMARKHWQVMLVDISDVGLGKARENAGGDAGRISFQTKDLASATWPPSAYDLLMVFFYLERRLLPKLADALRPGGLLIYKTYTHLALKLAKGPSHPMHLLQENELLHAFPAMTVLHYEETLRDRAVAELVARKRT
jgi:tellurite methyltransferase